MPFMKLILDMGISPKVIPWLEQLGHRAVPHGNDRPESPGFGDFGLGSGKRSGRSNIQQSRRITSVAQVTLAFGDLVPPDPAPPEEVKRRLEPVLKNYDRELKQGCLITIALLG